MRLLEKIEIGSNLSSQSQYSMRTLRNIIGLMSGNKERWQRQANEGLSIDYIFGGYNKTLWKRRNNVICQNDGEYEKLKELSRGLTVGSPSS